MPGAFGLDSVNAAGSMALVAGFLLTLAAVASPRHGVVARALRRRAFGRAVALDDLIAALYRLRERGEEVAARGRLAELLPAASLRVALGAASRRRLVVESPGGFALTDAGVARGAEIVRRHRLWESYLVDRGGVPPGIVHESAEQLEHVPIRPAGRPERDPHGRPIPEE